MRWHKGLLGMVGLLGLCTGPLARAQQSAPALYNLPALPRADFNRLAQQQGLTLFWRADDNGSARPEPAEIVALGADGDIGRFIKDGQFTAAFESAYRQLVEVRRREAVRRELDQGLPTLVETDLHALPSSDKALVRHILASAAQIEQIHLAQRGVAGSPDSSLALDAESRALFARNQGFWCVAPDTENDPFCHGRPDFAARRWDAYPPEWPQDGDLCERLRQQPASASLLDPFSVVRLKGEVPAALPLTAVYGASMAKVAAELRAAAAAIESSNEAALKRYLQAAALAFESNDWQAADEAWAAMNAENSAWYLRIAPDEVYGDLCQYKAGFHVSFARIDRVSLEWQAKLVPLRTRMEAQLAELLGPPYQARPVAFRMPDFIEIVLNAGESREPLGATVGQSLPNWGRVATEGRGRTVVMTNLFTDPDSLRLRREKAALLLDEPTMLDFTDDTLPGRLAFILHEAAHNLGPHSDYRVNGRTPVEVFGGGLASTLEELKAQTAALYYVPMLEQAGLISAQQARQIYVNEILWACDFVSRGMTTPEGNPKVYSQLAAVQLGTLAKAGVLTWDAGSAAGPDVGRFHLDFRRLPAVMAELMRRVGQIKVRGDVAAAHGLIDPFVSGSEQHWLRVAEIRPRILRFGRPSFVYRIRLDHP